MIKLSRDDYDIYHLAIGRLAIHLTIIGMTTLFSLKLLETYHTDYIILLEIELWRVLFWVDIRRKT